MAAKGKSVSFYSISVPVFIFQRNFEIKKGGGDSWLLEEKIYQSGKNAFAQDCRVGAKKCKEIC